MNERKNSTIYAAILAQYGWFWTD